MNNSTITSWEKKKDEILTGIDETIEKGSTNEDVLEIMRELINNSKLRTSITSYYEDVGREEV